MTNSIRNSAALHAAALPDQRCRFCCIPSVNAIAKPFISQA